MVEAAGIEPVALNRSGLSKNAHSGLVVNIDVGFLAHPQGYGQSIRNRILSFSGFLRKFTLISMVSLLTNVFAFFPANIAC